MAQSDETSLGRAQLNWDLETQEASHADRGGAIPGVSQNVQDGWRRGALKKVLGARGGRGARREGSSGLGKSMTFVLNTKKSH